jgi:hypothetical protein
MGEMLPTEGESSLNAITILSGPNKAFAQIQNREL